MINVHSNLSAAVDGRCSVSGKHSFRFFLFRNKLVMLPGNFVQWRMDRNMTLINGLYWNFRLVVVIWMVPRHRLFRSNIVRNQGHFEPANNYQRYIVLHSGTIEYQENSIWRRSRLDLQRRVFRTMTYTIWAESVLNMSQSRADGTMSSWLSYFRNFTNFHTVSYIIWTPLWTKCASAAAILSNISANE